MSMEQRILIEFIYTKGDKRAAFVIEDREELQAPVPEKEGYVLRGRHWPTQAHTMIFKQNGSPRKGMWFYE